MTEDEKLEHKRALNRAACARYAERHPDRVKAKQERQRERTRARSKAWHAVNKERSAAISKEWVRNNPEKVSAKQHRYCERHPDKIKEANDKFRSKNPEYSIIHYKNNRDNYNRRNAKWKKENKAAVVIHNLNRRARKANGKGITAGELATVRRMQKDKCAICKISLKNTGHADHIEPLARGGEHSARNIQLLCQPCNLRKAAKDPIDYMQSLGMLI